MKIPVIGTTGGDLKDILKNESNAFVISIHATSLAKAVERVMYLDTEKIQNIVENALILVKNKFDIGYIAKTVDKIYYSICIP